MPYNNCVISTATAEYRLTLAGQLDLRAAQKHCEWFLWPGDWTQGVPDALSLQGAADCRGARLGYESVSETISYWVKLEAWEIAMNANTRAIAPRGRASKQLHSDPGVSAVDQLHAGQPCHLHAGWADPSSYPTLANAAVCPVLTACHAPTETYGTLKHIRDALALGRRWRVRVSNADATTVAVAINNFGRGRHEGLFDTVTHVGWEDWTQGGFIRWRLSCRSISRGLPTYPAAEYDYAKQFS